MAGAEDVAEIVTEGLGEVTLVAARANMCFEVETRARSAADAAATNGTTVRAVQAAIASLGLESPEIRATSFRVGPEYVYEQTRRVAGYLAKATVEVTLRDFSQCGRLLDTALGAGATTAQEPRWVADGMEEARTRALQLAYAHARTDARALAAAAGGSLGPPIHVSTAEPGVGPMVKADMSMTHRTVDGAPDVRDVVCVEASVSVRWRLLSVA